MRITSLLRVRTLHRRTKCEPGLNQIRKEGTEVGDREQEPGSECRVGDEEVREGPGTWV